MKPKRTEAEVRATLRKGGCPDALIDSTVETMKTTGQIVNTERTEAEVRATLRKGGCPDALIDSTVETMKTTGQIAN